MNQNLKLREVDFIIITALEEEFDAVRKKIKDCQKLQQFKEDTGVYFRGKIPISGTSKSYDAVLLCLLGMGNNNATSAAANALRTWTAKYVVLVGIAGGIKSEGVDLGDIIIADHIASYTEKIIEKEEEYRWMPCGNINPRLLGESRHLKGEAITRLVTTERPGKGEVRRHIGPVVSGNKVIAEERALNIYRRTWPKLKGVEMEAGGVALAAIHSAKPSGFFMVRAVSDHADYKKSSRTVKKWRKYACDVAATYTIELIKQFLPPISLTSELAEAVQQAPEDKDSKKPSVEEELLYELIVDIDFEKQVNSAKKIINTYRAVSFFIHGESQCGQSVLAKRLLRFLPDANRSEREFYKLTISRSTRNSKSSFWNEICEELNTRRTDMHNEIISRLKTRDIIITIDNIGLVQKPVFEEIVGNFWKPLIIKVNQSFNSNSLDFNTNCSLILFLIDFNVATKFLESNLISHTDSDPDLSLPVCLPATGRLQEDSIKNWVFHATNKGLSVDDLAIEENIRDLMEQTEGGKVEQVYYWIYRFFSSNFLMLNLGL